MWSRSVITLAVVSTSILVLTSSAMVSPQGNQRFRRIPSKSFRSAEIENETCAARRRAIESIVRSTTLGLALVVQSNQPAKAFEKAYPTELRVKEGDLDLSQVRKAKMNAKRVKKERGLDYVGQNPWVFRGPKDVLTSVTWGGALWLLGGSRSNPLVTPIANLLYNEKQEKWLQDRNQGLFASPPFPVLGMLGIVFLALGIATDRLILLLAEGEANVSLQMAGVTLIGAASLELGRIASGEKKMTREEDDRSTELEKEFADFAEKRLLPGGNCHRNEVVRAFRRFNPKYRQSDSVEYPLTDLEIERLLRAWNRSRGNPEMSSAGFYSNLQINNQADVFR